VYKVEAAQHNRCRYPKLCIEGDTLADSYRHVCCFSPDLKFQSSTGTAPPEIPGRCKFIPPAEDGPALGVPGTWLGCQFNLVGLWAANSHTVPLLPMDLLGAAAGQQGSG
jgi:hypothetical protein